MTVDGANVAWNEDGTFTAAVTSQWGQNVHEVVIGDDLGNSKRTMCSYFAAARYAPENVQMSDAVVVEMTADAVDDGGEVEPIRSLTDMLHYAVESPAFTVELDEDLRGSIRSFRINAGMIRFWVVASP